MKVNGLFGGATSLLAAGLDATLQRQAVLTSNVAHLDTPGYVPRDVEFSSYLAQGEQEGSGVSLRRTHAAHIGGSASGVEGRLVERPDRAPGRDGNQVDLDIQMARIAHTSTQYAAQATAISKRLALLRYATSQ
jgi:flagellar basal-body rod protein FlgB